MISPSPLRSAGVRSGAHGKHTPAQDHVQKAKVLCNNRRNKKPSTQTENAQHPTNKPTSSLRPCAAPRHNSSASMASLWKSALRRSTSFILSGEYGFLTPLLVLIPPLPPPASPGRLWVGGGRKSSASDGRSELSRRTCTEGFSGFGRGRVICRAGGRRKQEKGRLVGGGAGAAKLLVVCGFQKELDARRDQTGRGGKKHREA